MNTDRLRRMDQPSSARMEFDDNRLLPILFGDHDRHLVAIEHRLDVAIACRGNILTITGPAADQAREVLQLLYDRLCASDTDRNDPPTLTAASVDATLRSHQDLGSRSPAAGFLPSLRTREGVPGPGAGPEAGAAAETAVEDETRLVLETWKSRVRPLTPVQSAYLRALSRHDLVFGLGPAGTGKTFLAVAMAVHLKRARHIDRIVISRPAVEAGEHLGFLPGSLEDKVDPYLRPLIDALQAMIPGDLLARLRAQNELEIAPIAFMRGRTLADAFVIIDEAQNTTPAQMKMILTRLGEHSRFVITGDPSQTDLPPGIASGLLDAVDILNKVEGVAVTRFSNRDVIRHPLVARIVEAYEQRDRQRLSPSPAGATKDTLLEPET